MGGAQAAFEESHLQVASAMGHTHSSGNRSVGTADAIQCFVA
jgi:hypothetical protein